MAGHSNIVTLGWERLVQVRKHLPQYRHTIRHTTPAPFSVTLWLQVNRRLSWPSQVLQLGSAGAAALVMNTAAVLAWSSTWVGAQLNWLLVSMGNWHTCRLQNFQTSLLGTQAS
jgi:hypothetical protein